MGINGWQLVSGDLELNVKKMKMIELSKLNPKLDCDEVVNFVFDNGYEGVINDLNDTSTNVCYDAEDLYKMWDDLKKMC